MPSINEQNNSTVCSQQGEPTLSDFAKVQLQQAIDTYRTQLTLMVQIQTVLVAANATVLGFGFSSKSAGLMLLACIFPLLVAFMGRSMLRLTLPVIYTAISLEEHYRGPCKDSLMKSFIGFSISPEFVGRLMDAALIESWEARVEALRSMNPPILKVTRWVLFAVFYAQLVAPISLVLFFGWKWL